MELISRHGCTGGYTNSAVLAGETLKTAENTLGTVHIKRANQTLETEPWGLATGNSPL